MAYTIGRSARRTYWGCGKVWLDDEAPNDYRVPATVRGGLRQALYLARAGTDGVLRRHVAQHRHDTTAQRMLDGRALRWSRDAARSRARARLPARVGCRHTRQRQAVG